MATNTDAFEVYDTSTDDATETSESISTDVEYKYAQLEVPNFEIEGGFLGDKTTPSGSSFIRMGSFPDFELNSTTTTADGETTTARSVANVASDAPTGFDTSLLLAALVGDATAMAAVITSDTDSTTLDEHGVISSNPSVGDANGLLAYGDDTRVHKYDGDEVLYIDGADRTNSTTNRKAESKRLLTKGGWWDHAGGNRISTTAGDKVEVIQGNYKLVVLGRRNPSTIGDDADVTDSSGGYTYSKKYVYLEDEKIWATYESSSPKRAYKKTGGVEVSEFTGTKQVKIIGEDPGEGGAIKNPGDNDPVIISKTWAKRTESYTGSANKPVNYVESRSFIDSKVDYDVGLSRVTIKSYATDSVSMTGIGGANVSTSICGMDVSIKVMPLSLSFSAVLQTFDAKFGWVWKYDKTHSGIYLGKEEISGTEKKLTAIKTDIANISNALVATSNHLANTDNRVSSNYNVLASSVLHLAAQINYL